MKDLQEFRWLEDDLKDVSLAFTILYVKDLGAEITQHSRYYIPLYGAKIIPTFPDTKRISRVELNFDK